MPLQVIRGSGHQSLPSLPDFVGNQIYMPLPHEVTHLPNSITVCSWLSLMGPT